MSITERSTSAARVFTAAVVSLGLTAMLAILSEWSAEITPQFVSYFLMAVFAAALRIGRPAFPGVLSAGTLFVLIGLVEFSLPEVLLLATTTMLVQSVIEPEGRLRSWTLLFRVANIALAVTAAQWFFQSAWAPGGWLYALPALLAGATGLFAMNSLPAAAAVAFEQGGAIPRVWHRCVYWTLPGYAVAAASAAAVAGVNATFGWRIGAAMLPLLYFVYRWAHRYHGVVKAEGAYYESLAEQQQRVIETLGMAIEARQYSNNDRLKRTEVYSVGIGRVLGMNEVELSALRVAAQLRDIGILAVPEQITSKPGRLSPEEYAKVKVHSEIGATILDRVKFPMPVAPIVRAHHERWNGSGYPDGLKGLDIPLGARVLGAVDCMAALMVKRCDRDAISHEAAVRYVAEHAGVYFDPAVVRALLAHHDEFERELQTRLPSEERDFRSSILAARQETQEILQLNQVLGRSLCLSETLSTFADCMRRVTHSDALVVYLLRDGKLVPEYAAGAGSRLFYSIEIPVGRGPSGRAAKGEAVRNGDPALELSQLHSAGGGGMRSALSVPLDGPSGTQGVLTLYRQEPDSFSPDELRVVAEVTETLGSAVENSLRYQSAADSATTDALTGLPNARSLFLHLDGEMSRCRRGEEPLAVLVCDLNGFKHVNDTYGHLAGNEVLGAVAGVLRASCREYDFVARMGGDEFVMVLPGLPAGAVVSKAKAVACAAARAAEEVCEGSGVTLSVGQARYPDDGRDADSLLSKADQRMYLAKKNYSQFAGSRGFDFDCVAGTVH